MQVYFIIEWRLPCLRKTVNIIYYFERPKLSDIFLILLKSAALTNTVQNLNNWKTELEMMLFS